MIPSGQTGLPRAAAQPAAPASCAIKARVLGKRFELQTRRERTLFGQALAFLGRGPAWRPLWALRGIDLEIARGHCLGIVGPNGSGKSTLLLLLSGILPPTEGYVEINGRANPFLSPGSGLYNDLTVVDNLRLAGALFGLTREEVEERLPEMVEFAEIHDYLYARLGELSSGFQARTVFSAALHAPIDILLLDEVFAVGDGRFRRKCLDRMSVLRGEGKTMVIASHDMDLVRFFCDSAICLEKGEIVARGDPGEVTRSYVERMGVGE